MRTSGISTILLALSICPSLSAESRGPTVAANASGPAAAKPALVSSPLSDSSSCTLTGTAIPDLDLQLTDADGQPVARFGGVALPLALSDLPERADGKVRVTTGGTGRLRVRGFVPVQAVPIYLKEDVVIVKGHVTLPLGTQVEYAGKRGEAIRVRVKTKHPLAETYDATVSCAGLTLEAPAASKWAPPGHARGYLMKQPSVPLFDRAGSGAEVVSTIHLASDARSVLFFGDRREGDFIHVLYRRDVGINGWISVKDLEILPRGEVSDQSASKIVPPTDKRLKMKVEGQLYRANDELPLYGKADPKLPPIGTVTKDTELYVLDVMVGWANVLPKQLDVVPLGERHFWVKAKELGL